MNFFPWQANGSNGESRLPHILLEDDPEVGPSDGNNKKYHRPPAHYDDPAWHLGWTDGRLGQSEVINEEVLLARARVERQEEIRSVRRLIAVAQGRAEALKTRHQLIQKKLDYVHDYYLRLWARRNENSSESSLPLALMYLFFGMMLFIADVPLSLTLVADGFEIPRQVSVGGESVDVGMIFQRPLAVLQNLWEPLFLAVGIALMGIVVKFFMDTIVLREEGDPRLSTTTAIGVSLAFILFVVATYCLGQFRAEIRVEQLERDALDFDNVTFVLLTLAFPIAGGLCLSAGWRKWERAKHYYFTLLRLRWLEWRYGVVTGSYGEQVEQVGSLKQILERDGDDLASAAAQLRWSVYRHGYQRGSSVPETLDAGETIYGYCERTLKRMLGKKARHKLQLEP